MKNLIAYFSRKGNNHVNGKIEFLPVGNTEVAAKKLQEMTGGDLFEIRRAEPYPEDYQACVQESVRELKAAARPALADDMPDVSGYDRIYLGYPSWCGTMPMPVFTFLASCDLAGKAICPFCTNEGSGLGHSVEDIKAACPQAQVLPGLSLRGATVAESDGEIKAWLETLPDGE